MASSRSSNNDSFDLLLDTMCNLFGGIVLITILLVLLSPSSSEIAVETPNQDDRSTTTAEVAVEQQKEIERLREVLMAKENEIAELRSALPEQKIKSPAQARKELRESQRELSNDEKKIVRLRLTLDKLKKDNELKEGQLSKANAELKGIERNVASRKLRLPRLKKTEKRQVLLALRYSRLYVLSPLSGPRVVNGRTEFNPDYVNVSYEPGGLEILELIHEAGILIGSASSMARVEDMVLGRLEARDDFLDFFVYPDSYTEMLAVKARVLSSGFDYNWHPMPADAVMEFQPMDSLEAQ